MSELEKVLVAETLVLAVARARRSELPDDLRALPAQAQVRVDALLAAVGRESGAAGGGVFGNRGEERTPLVVALQRAIATAYAAVQKIDDEESLRVVAQVMAGDGQSLALLRQSMNRQPVPDAFETGKAP